MTEQLNILYKDNWTALATAELAHFQRQLQGSSKCSSHVLDDSGWPGATSTETKEWSFASAFLYSLSLVTTVGRLEGYQDKQVSHVKAFDDIPEYIYWKQA